MKGGDAHTLYNGAMFRDPVTNKKYRIAGIEEGIYFVIDVSDNKIIMKKTKDFFQPLEFIGSYDFRTGNFTSVGGKSRRRRHKTRQTKRRKHRKSKSRRHRR
jgi:hypothetical protein